MLIYHSIIECCLELRHLRSSILLLVIIMDGLRVTDDHLCATRQLPILFLCRPLFGRAKEYGESFLSGLVYSCLEILVSSHLLWGDVFIRLLPRSLLVLATCVFFPYVSRALILLLFLAKKTPNILLLLHYTLHLKFETKRKLLHPLYGKTPFPLDSINGWFCFH